MGSRGMSDDDEYELKVEEPDDGPFDPAAAAAAPYLQKAAEKVEITERTTPKLPRWPLVTGVFFFPWYLTTLATWIYLTIAFSVAGFVVGFIIYVMIVVMVPTFGVALAVPTAMLLAAVLSYASASYLCVIQETSGGAETVEEWPSAGWREWFWTLPSTLGVAIATFLLASAIDKLLFTNSWFLICTVWFLLYPVMQLSVLEADSLTVPFSKPIWMSLWKQKWSWIIFFAETCLMIAAILVLTMLAASINPFLAAIILGPLLATFLLIYARLLGRLAWCITAAMNVRKKS